MKYKGFNVSIQEIDQVDDVMRNEFATLDQLRGVIKTHKKDSKEHKLLVRQIQAIKFSLTNKVFKVYKVQVEQKNNHYFQCYIEYPTPKDIKDTLDVFKSKLRQKRNRNKDIVTSKKSILGYNYETIGGTFSKINSIIEIQNKTDQMTRIQTPKVPAKEFKSNYVGVELELFCKLDRVALLKRFVEAKLAGYIYVKDDGSLRPENNYYPHEVTILCKQDYVKDVIPSIIKVLRSPDCDAAVNNTCGMHIHIDIRNRNPYDTYSRLVKALPLLNRLVPKDRINNRFCQTNTSPFLADHYRDGRVENGVIAGREERYKAINPMSVVAHKTIEVRLHSGTVNTKKILNWIDICISIADCEFNDKIDTPESFYQNIKKDDKLIEYMKERMLLFDKGPVMDTKADYVLDVAGGF